MKGESFRGAPSLAITVCEAKIYFWREPIRSNLGVKNTDNRYVPGIVRRSTSGQPILKIINLFGLRTVTFPPIRSRLDCRMTMIHSFALQKVAFS